MKVFWLAPLILAALAMPAHAAWNFSQRIAVTEVALPGVFHHLDSAGRRNIALSGNRIGVVWEDNRNGQPQVYFASMQLGRVTFAEAIRISDGNEAYEPVIAALDNNRFIVLWEQDGAVWARRVAENSADPALQLSSGPAGHASVSAWKGEAFTVWREQQKAYPKLRFSRLTHEIDGKL